MIIGFCGEGFFEGIVRMQRRQDSRYSGLGTAGGRKAARSKRRYVGVQRQEKGVAV